MRFWVASMLFLAIASSAAEWQPDYDRFFERSALRIDLYHSGDASEESYTLDELREEPFYAGSRSSLIDTLNRGEYLIRIFDLATNMLVFSRGYSTIFAEWRTTEEALRGFGRTFHESLILPFPKRPVQVRIERRSRMRIFETVFDMVIDPKRDRINRERRASEFRVVELFKNGSPENQVDIVILGDGYRRDEMHKLRKDSEKAVSVLFEHEPLRSRKHDFSVRLIECVSTESGIDEPHRDVWRNSILECSFDALGIERYVLTMSNRRLRDIAGNVPYDAIVVLVNSSKYGGGGIFGLYAIATADNEHSGYVLTHEFGHAFAGLGDEYYSSEVTYNDMYPRGVEPWEPNITALLDSTAIKWGDLVREGTPIPTPDDSTYAGVVGCFEGAGYSAKGLYRPMRDCIMFSRKCDSFCAVCRRAIEKMIDFYVK